jgi:MYXO-CTERM domain-containing protein
MKTTQRRNTPILSLGLALAAVPALHAATIVDFDPTGELAEQFPLGGAYTENATGGLNSSIGVNLANLAVDTLSGSQAGSLAATGFANGASFTVGMFFNLSAFGSSTTGTQATHFLRLGLTNAAGDTFANMPFSTIDLTNVSTGASRFLVRDGGASGGGTGGAVTGVSFDLDLGQWYYFETTISRPGNTSTTALDYKMDLWNATSAGVIGSSVATLPSTSFSVGVTSTEMNGSVFGGFKGSGTTTGVLDNFYVSNTGVSLIPEPSAAALGLLGMMGLALHRRRWSRTSFWDAGADDAANHPLL